jgi:hypothetical protein
MIKIDGDFIAYQPGSGGVHSFYPTLEAAQTDAERLELESGKPYAAGHFDDWWKAKSAAYLEGGPLVEITEEQYDDALGVLPPIYPRGGMGFVMSEFLAGSISTQYATRSGRFYSKTIDVADRSTWISPEAIDALG